jgi:hypothetical protein
VVATSGAVGQLNSYYLKGGYKNLSGDAKSKVKSLYANLGKRGPVIQAAVFDTLTTKVPYRGSQQPSWVALADDATVRSLLAAIEPRSDTSNGQQLKFAAGVAAKAGATGTDVKAALAAVQVGKNLVNGTKSPALREGMSAELRRSVARSDYPVVQQSIPPPPPQ